MSDEDKDSSTILVDQTYCSFNLFSMVDLAIAAEMLSRALTTRLYTGSIPLDWNLNQRWPPSVYHCRHRSSSVTSKTSRPDHYQNTLHARDRADGSVAPADPTPPPPPPALRQLLPALCIVYPILPTPHDPPAVKTPLAVTLSSPSLLLLSNPELNTIPTQPGRAGAGLEPRAHRKPLCHGSPSAPIDR